MTKLDSMIFLLKMSVIFSLFMAFSFKISIVLSIVIAATYQYVIAFFNNLHVIPAMDYINLLDDEEARINIITVAVIEKLGENHIKERLVKALNKYPKLSYSIKKTFGDFYYQQTDVNTVLEKCFVMMPKEKGFKNERDLDKYVEANLNGQIPHDQP